MDQKVCLCLVWLFSSVGAGGIIVSCVTTYWQSFGNYHEGLWQECYGGSCNKVEMLSDDDKLNAVKALIVIGIVFIGIADLVSIVGSCLSKNVNVALVVLQVIALACCVGGFGLYTHELKKWAHDWDWSFMVGWAGCGVFGLSFICLSIALCMR